MINIGDVLLKLWNSSGFASLFAHFGEGGWQNLVMIIIACVLLYLAIVKKFEPLLLFGIAFGLGAAVLYASVVILNKYIKGVSGIQRTFLQFVSAIVILVPYVWCTGGVTLHTMNGTGWICLAVVGLVHTGMAYCLYFSALKDIPGQEAAILSYVDPLVAVMISVFVLGEPMTVVQIIGGLLILGFTLWNEIRPKRT